MQRSYLLFLLSAFASKSLVLSHNSTHLNIKHLPDQTAKGQSGTNQCKYFKASNSNSSCQNVFINNVRDFCLWAPATPKPVAMASEEVVSWCLKKGYGTRLIPEGAITGAHFIKTPNYIQVTGVGNFSAMNIAEGDQGSMLASGGHNATGLPRGGLVFTRNQPNKEHHWRQIHSWTSFIRDNRFSFRACYGKQAAKYCTRDYDKMGAEFNHPGDYRKGNFNQCHAKSGLWPGYYNGKKWQQGTTPIPAPHHPTKKYNCKKYKNLHAGTDARVKPYRRSVDKAAVKAAAKDTFLDVADGLQEMNDDELP